MIVPIKVYGQTAPSVTIDTEFGFQGIVKSGNCFPLRIKVTNRQEQQTYRLIIQVPVQAESKDMSSSIWMNSDAWNSYKDRVINYEKEMDLKAGECKEEIFYLNLPVLEGVVNIYVKEDNHIVVQEAINCRFTDNTYRILTGIITTNTTGIEKLDGMHVEMDEYYGSDTFVKIIQLNPEDIYTNPDAMNQLDVLIVEDGTKFSIDQQIALNEWKQTGGFLLVQNGESLEVCFQKLLEGDNKENFLTHLHDMTMYFYTDSSDLTKIPVSEKPDLTNYLLLLLIYILIVGPGLYYYLKRKNRQKNIWIYIYANAFAFLLMIAILGMKTNVRAPYICYHTLYEQQNQILKETIDFSIQAPYNSSYHMYVDNSYRITPVQENTYGSNDVRLKNAETVTISYGDEKNKIAIDHVATFDSNMFTLKKNRILEDEKQIQLTLKVKEDGITLTGGWKNPTAYEIKNAVLVMPNQVAAIGNMEPYTAVENQDYNLYSYGNNGMNLFMKEHLDFSLFQHPEYEASNLENQIWKSLYNAKTNETFLIGIVNNETASFQNDTGYKTYGTALLRIPVTVDWQSNGTVWCPNLKMHSESLDGNYNAETNLMSSEQATVDYSVQSFISVDKLEFYQMDYDDERYFYPFEGRIVVYNWITSEFQELQNWKTALTATDMQQYISSTGILRIRYILDEINSDVSRSCMLPCIRLCGKVRE